MLPNVCFSENLQNFYFLAGKMGKNENFKHKGKNEFENQKMGRTPLLIFDKNL
jgi:hypothetical protein